MLNFRYHVVSLVAVFLALAIGILIGVGALDRPTVDALRDRIDVVQANADARRRENDQLRTQVEQLNATADAVAPFAITDRLPNVQVAVVAVRGLDGDSVKKTVDLARRGGGTAPGVLWLEDPWKLTDKGAVQTLATAAGVESGKRATVRGQALAALAARLATGHTGGGTDVLRALVDAGFVSYEGVGDAGNVALADLGGPTTRATLIVGTTGDLAGDEIVLPFARGAVQSNLPLVGAELYQTTDKGPERGALVAPIRNDSAISKQVSTVDDYDQSSGALVTLLAVSDLGRNSVGHYGFGEDASAPAPTWWQP